MKKINLFLIVSFLLVVSCGNVGKILRNEKIKTTDEFLVEKKKPLILPPDIDKVPEPGSITVEKSKDEDVIKNILKSKKKNDNSKNTSSSLEEAILKRLPK